MISSVFEIEVEQLGRISFVKYDNEEHAEIIHPWVNMEYAKFWMLNNTTLDQVKAEYDKIMAPVGTSVYLGYHNEKPSFLTEVYDPSEEEMANHYTVQEGDMGMHILVAPAEKRIPNFTQNVFKSIMLFMFEFHGAKRVIVEPDISNSKIHKLNEKAGFTVLKDKVEFSFKTARIEECTKERFLASQLYEIC